MPPIEVKAFTLPGNGFLRELRTDVGITHAFDPKVQSTPSTQLITYSGLWDTGASISSISQRVVDELKLPSLGPAKVETANKELITTTHLIAIMLPNGMGFSQVLVTCGQFSPPRAGSKPLDVLIGMDVIIEGDFSITNLNGKTTFSFRTPSIKKIDYVEEGTLHQSLTRSTLKVGRNDNCPCGSGIKYKYCCGRSHA